MNGPTLDAGFAIAFDDVDVEDTLMDLSAVAILPNGTRARQNLPAWKRIEEYREMRELNRHLMDDVYGSKPVQTLWDGD